MCNFTYIIFFCYRKSIRGMVKIKISIFSFDARSYTSIRNIKVSVVFLCLYFNVMQKYLMLYYFWVSLKYFFILFYTSGNFFVRLFYSIYMLILAWSCPKTLPLSLHSFWDYRISNAFHFYVLTIYHLRTLFLYMSQSSVSILTTKKISAI